MTDTLTTSSDVIVAVDAATAFKAFTEEMDLWWQRGPINFWSDAGHVLEVRCETGVGGRILEVLDDPAGADLDGRASPRGSQACVSRSRARSTTC